MIPLSANNVWLWVQRDDGKWSFLKWFKNILHRHPEVSLEVVEVETLLISPVRKSLWFSPRIGWSRIKRDVPDLLQQILFVHQWLYIWIFHLLEERLLPLHWVLLRRIPMRPSFPAPRRLHPLCHPSKFLPRTERIQGKSRQDFLSKLMNSWLAFPRDKEILNQWTKRDGWSFKKFSKTSFMWVFPSDKRSWTFRR